MDYALEKFIKLLGAIYHLRKRFKKNHELVEVLKKAETEDEKEKAIRDINNEFNS